ncbi:hypothetical protein MKW94_000904 [Papaver nudicaule]|uniref:Transmembrane protein n=1 Tax=Papaver nudicaule TaxID=74823 RepID=A0AA41SJE4_PAPNU|nr:hypothetical protein [Papaver nudicaule]
MGSSSFSLFNLLFISIFLYSSVSSVYSDPAKDIYEVLKSHGLPIGLLPKGVTEFSLSENGRFEVHLDEACNAKFENVVHYDRNVTGTLSYGQIRELTGIQAQELFLWFPVNGIRVDIPSSGLIYFDVGVIYKQFSLSLFETPPDCTIVSSNGGPSSRKCHLRNSACFVYLRLSNPFYLILILIAKLYFCFSDFGDC